MIKLEARTKEEMHGMFVTLMEFLYEHPEYQYIEDDNGVRIVISPLKVAPKTIVETPKKQKLV